MHAICSHCEVDPRSAVGLLGGEFIKCVYARLPERCGHTVHCTSCTIRSAVESTVHTGQPITRQPARLRRDQGPVDMLISATRKGEYVQLIIEDLPAIN